MTLPGVEAVWVGLTAGLAFTEIQRTLHGLTVERLLLSYWLAGLVVGLPVMGTIGLAVWRCCWAWHSAARPPRAAGGPVLRWSSRAAGTGAALGTGLVVGNELSR